jgi:hypothetical protein
VPGFTHDELVDKALTSLIEIMRAYKDGPVKEPATLRFVLAFLYTGTDREPFDTFFQAAIRGNPDDVLSTAFGRFQTMRSAYAHIARLHGRDYW